MANGEDIERGNGNGAENEASRQQTACQQKGLCKLGRSSSTILLAATQIRERNTAGIYAVICGTVCCSLLLVIVFLVCLGFISFASIIIGVKYLHQCPIEPNIPVMLIIDGVIAVVICILDTIEKCRTEGQEDVKPSAVIFFNGVLKLAQVILYIYTAVIVYRSYSDVKYGESDGDVYCHPVAYLFAFSFITLDLILLGIGLVLLCCICCFAICCWHAGYEFLS